MTRPIEPILALAFLALRGLSGQARPNFGFSILDSKQRAVFPAPAASVAASARGFRGETGIGDRSRKSLQIITD